MERIDFQGTDISGVLDRLPDEERNRLPFGVVKLDTQGMILSYNMAEAEISGVKPADVIGKNFFLEVAVCTQRPEFYGRFRDAMDNDRVLNLIFDYEFQNARYAAVHDPIKVRVHMFTSYEIGGKKIVWLMVKRVASRQQARPQVNDVAAAAAAQLGIQTFGQLPGSQGNLPPIPAAFTPEPASANAMPPGYPPNYPGFAQQPQYPIPPQQPPFGGQPFPGFPAPQAYAGNPGFPLPQFAPPAPPAPETNGTDILIRFDDV